MAFYADSSGRRTFAAGRSLVRDVQQLAFVLGMSIALIPILVVMAFYVPGRLRLIREDRAPTR